MPAIHNKIVAFWKIRSEKKHQHENENQNSDVLRVLSGVIWMRNLGLFNSNAMDHKINTFEMWCYRRMLRVSRTSHTTSIYVLEEHW